MSSCSSATPGVTSGQEGKENVHLIDGKSQCGPTILQNDVPGSAKLVANYKDRHG